MDTSAQLELAELQNLNCLRITNESFSSVYKSLTMRTDNILLVKIFNFAECVQLGGKLMRFIAYLMIFIAKNRTKTRPPASGSSKIPDDKLINFAWR